MNYHGEFVNVFLFRAGEGQTYALLRFRNAIRKPFNVWTRFR